MLSANVNKITLNKYLPFIVALFIVFGVSSFFNLYLGLELDTLKDHLRIVLGLIEQWLVVAVLILLIFYWEHRPLSSIGFKKISKPDIFWGFIVLVIGCTSFLITGPLVSSLNLVSQSSEISGVLSVPLGLRILMVLTAGITEEIIFRGYLIERLNSFTRRLFISAVISFFAFTIFHIPFWGIGATIQVGVWAIPVTILYVRRRNLTICILVHILTNATVLVPLLFN